MIFDENTSAYYISNKCFLSGISQDETCDVNLTAQVDFVEVNFVIFQNAVKMFSYRQEVCKRKMLASLHSWLSGNSELDCSLFPVADDFSTKEGTLLVCAMKLLHLKCILL